MPVKKKKKDLPAVTPEARYVTIEEVNPEAATKARILWIAIVGATVFLVSGWLFFLRADIKKTYSQFNFKQLSSDISKRLSAFENQMKIDEQTPPVTEDLNAIKDSIVEQLQAGTDSSLWPSHNLPKYKIFWQSPLDWTFKDLGDRLIIANSTSASPTASIEISVTQDLKKYGLARWLKNNADFDATEWTQDNRNVFATTTNHLSFIQTATSTEKYLRLDYLAGNQGLIYEINSSVYGDLEKLKPLVEEILKTIKTN